MSEWFCTDCGEPCRRVRESFEYAGTHCTHGQAGTHYTGVVVSHCCDAPVSDEPLDELEGDHD